MALLLLGLVLLIGVHLVPTVPSARQALVAEMGEGGYKLMFSAVSLLGLGLIVTGMGRAPELPLWQPPPLGRYFTLALMLPAFILLVAAYLPGNTHRWIRHPMLWGVVLWSIGHLLANGTLAALLLFGSLGLYSFYAMFSANRRGAQLASTAQPWSRDLLVVVVGCLLYLGSLYLHTSLFGTPVITISMLP